MEKSAFRLWDCRATMESWGKGPVSSAHLDLDDCQRHRLTRRSSLYCRKVAGQTACLAHPHAGAIH